VLVIYDLEFTTWDGAQSRGWTGPGEFREIVQIGALRVVPDTLVVDAEFEILVKPSRNPDVSDFFAALTGIDRSAVEQRGTDFLTALNAFLDFCDGSYALSYGNDMVVIGENIVLQIPEGRAPARPLPPFVNIRPHLNAILPATAQLAAGSLSRGLTEAAGLGLTEAGEAEPIHDALLDCRSILEALRYLRKLGHPLFCLQ